MAERRQVNVEIANWLDKVARKRDLLLGFAQRGSGEALIVGIDLAPGNEI